MPRNFYRPSCDLIQVVGTWNEYVAIENGAQASEEALLPLISEAHERQHHLDLSSTPFGLLLWRIDNSIAGDAHYLCRNFGFPYPPKSVRDIVPSNSSLILPPHLEQLRFYSMRVGEELESLMALRTLILDGGGRDVTVAEAVETANRGIDVLRSRFDLRSKWKFTTHLPSGMPFNPVIIGNGRVTGRDVLERSATAQERLLIEVLEDRGHDVLQWWLDLRDALARYRDSYGFLTAGEELSSTFDRARWAFEGPCDPAILSPEDIPLESALPNWRWAAVSGVFLPPGTRETVFEACGIANDPRQVYEDLSTGLLNGPEGMFADAWAKGRTEATDPALSYSAFVLDRYSNNFRYIADLGVGETPTTSMVTIFDDFSRISAVQPDPDAVAILLESLMPAFALQECSKSRAFGETTDVAELVRILYLMQLRVHSLRDESMVNVIDPVSKILQFLWSENLIDKKLRDLGLVYLVRLVCGPDRVSTSTHRDLIRWALSVPELP